MSSIAPRPLPRVLCVDDDEYVLAMLKRTLHGKFEVHAESVPVIALNRISKSAATPYAVIVSDLVMPGIDGVTLLARIREISPDTVRILLTGQANLDGAIGAVNDGEVYRFLTKPFSPAALITAITAAVEHHRLITAERVLLEQTLRGAVKALIDILTLVSPSAFARGTRLQRYVRRVATTLGVTNLWEIEIAALLSQLGTVSLPTELVDKLHAGGELNAEEQLVADGVPALAASFIAEIPRLEDVHEILLFQSTCFDGTGAPRAGVRGPALPLGARILKIATDLDSLEASGVEPRVAIWTLATRRTSYDPKVLQAFRSAIEQDTEPVRVQHVRLGDVRPGMVFAMDVVSPSGLLLAARGQEVGRALTERLRYSSHGTLLDQQVTITMAASDA